MLIAFLLMAASAIAFWMVMRSNQVKHANDVAGIVPDSILDITDVPEEYHPTYEEIEDAILDDMAKAFATVESGNKVSAWNKVEDAIGCLQIRPIMVREANNIMGEEFFSLEDRWDREMSYYIFEVIMRRHNPELDIDQACDIWNPGCSRSYRENVKTAYANTMAESLERRGY